MKCKNCGVNISPGEKFCPECGSKVKRDKKKKYFLFGIVVGVCLCLIFGFGYKMLNNSHRYDQLIEYSLQFEEAENYDAALLSNSFAAHINPKNSKAYIHMANIFITTKQFDKAASILRIGEENTNENAGQFQSVQNHLEKNAGNRTVNNKVRVPEYEKYVRYYKDIKTKEDIEKITSDYRRDMNGEGNHLSGYYNGWIYYLNGSSIYKMRTDGSEKESIYTMEGYVGQLFKISGSKAFYVKGSNERNQICLFDLNTLKETKILEIDEGNVLDIKIENQKVYYMVSIGKDNYMKMQIKEISMENPNESQIVLEHEGSITAFGVDGDWIYYTEFSSYADDVTPGSFYRFNQKTGKKEVLVKKVYYVSNILCQNEKIYYDTYKNENYSRIYYYNLKDKKSKLVTEDQFEFFLNIYQGNCYSSNNAIKSYDSEGKGREIIKEFDAEKNKIVDIVANKLLIFVDEVDKYDLYLADLDGENMHKPQLAGNSERKNEEGIEDTIDGKQLQKKEKYILNLQRKDNEISGTKEALNSQTVEMASKAGELYKFWDDELNTVYQKLKRNMSEKDFEKLRAEERKWITYRDNELKKVDDQWGAGSARTFISPSEEARLEEIRTYELIDLLYGSSEDNYNIVAMDEYINLESGETLANRIGGMEEVTRYGFSSYFIGGKLKFGTSDTDEKISIINNNGNKNVSLYGIKVGDSEEDAIKKIKKEGFTEDPDWSYVKGDVTFSFDVRDGKVTSYTYFIK